MCIASSVPFFALVDIGTCAACATQFLFHRKLCEPSRDNPIHTITYVSAFAILRVSPRPTQIPFENAHTFTVYSQFYAFRFVCVCQMLKRHPVNRMCDDAAQLTKPNPNVCFAFEQFTNAYAGRLRKNGAQIIIMKVVRWLSVRLPERARTQKSCIKIGKQ